ncbi:Galactose oxidase [Ananas comosus]|uniref:Galactose oxidase n=1 Tax=Ananas comosus TaxID=4615 RepID=A0A199UKL4_ANACO|nr:Galactose oxidase [Ananas comosus]
MLTLTSNPLLIVEPYAAAIARGCVAVTATYIDGNLILILDYRFQFLSSCEDCDWVEDLEGLSARRWYATDHILPDGRVIVVGGRRQFSYEFVPKVAPADRTVFALPFLRAAKDASENNLYPFVHLAPDGNLFVFANNKSVLLDYANHRVLKNFPDMPGGASRNYPSSGSSVLLPLMTFNRNAKAEVMVCGGAPPTSYSMASNGTFAPASSSCGRLAITEESPEWEMEEMPVGRVMGDMVLLPTGDVLIINGAMRGTAGWGLGREPVLHPVLYKVGGIRSNESRGFEVLRPTTIPRLYHSTARLMVDGRVLVGGSNPNIRYVFASSLYPTELSLEAFYPPYLDPEGSKTPRPRITSVKSEWKYGERITIGFQMKGGEGEVAVTMVAPAFTTHSFSMSQRVLVLEAAAVVNCSSSSGGFCAAEGFAPPTAAVAPPGYYMLFVVHGGVPSRGKWVHVE